MVQVYRAVCQGIPNEDHDEEVIASPLEGGTVPRFSSSTAFDKDKGCKRLDLRRRRSRAAASPLEGGAVLRFSLFLFLLPSP
ncbi:hypothetical protein BHE74_00031788 [Ensete ventricosum]|nr:hypothetical protein GW17_00038290 [Ensete ventricosum]RWW61172.1 hypothetical protein BHE74_00031788 [Ensete ventricosum]RZS09124.1 hypothetical protein BHM03_00040176 [Ensete ventricosum]